jgi:hypothetical protein
VSLLVTFNQAIEGVIQNNPKARANPKALAQLDGYKRLLVSSLSANLQRFGMKKVSKVESLREIIEEMGGDPLRGITYLPILSRFAFADCNACRPREALLRLAIRFTLVRQAKLGASCRVKVPAE